MHANAFDKPNNIAVKFEIATRSYVSPILACTEASTSADYHRCFVTRSSNSPCCRVNGPFLFDWTDSRILNKIAQFEGN